MGSKELNAIRTETGTAPSDPLLNNPVKQISSPSSEIKNTQEISTITSFILQRASSGSHVAQSTWRQFNPLWFSPLSILSLWGCSDDYVCSDPTCHSQSQTPPETAPGAPTKSIPNPNSGTNPQADEVNPDGGVADSGPIGFDANKDSAMVSGMIMDAAVESGMIVEGGTEIQTNGMDAGTEINTCEAPANNNGEGTPQSPFNFRALVLVEEGTRQYALAQGRDIENSISNLFNGLNAAFNNGQLANSYDFSVMDIQFKSLDPQDPHYPPRPRDTTEDEDFIVLYDQRVGINQRDGAFGIGTIRIGTFDPFSPDNARSQFALIHETGHFRGAIDLYNIYIDGVSRINEVFPGNLFNLNVASIMGIPPRDQWDPLSIGLINYTAGDPNKDSICALTWVPTWSPEHIQVKVTGTDGLVIPNASVEIYRLRGSGNLSTEDLWFSGTTDPDGRLELPTGIPTTYPGAGWLYTAFLIAVHHNGEDYLNWYNLSDIAVPYLEGTTSLELNATIDEATHYDPKTVDLSVENISVSPTVAFTGDPISRTMEIKNNGPDPFNGDVTIQWWLSSDQVFEENGDRGFGGYTRSLQLAPGDSTTIVNSNNIPSVPTGSYYPIVQITTHINNTVDPESTNNFLANPIPIQITSN